MLVVATLLAGTVLAQSGDGWTCVAGEGGRWRCNEGGEAAPAAPLPALEVPTNTPGPDVYGLGNRSSPEPTNIVDQLFPAAPTTTAPGRYTLVIASVSGTDEIAGFVESYGLDPDLVEYMPVNEASGTRQLILWGRFSSPSQAARALVAMPSVVRAMRPQVSDTATFATAPAAFATLAAGQAGAAPTQALAGTPTENPPPPAAVASASSPPEPAPRSEESQAPAPVAASTDAANLNLPDRTDRAEVASTSQPAEPAQASDQVKAQDTPPAADPQTLARNDAVPSDHGDISAADPAPRNTTPPPEPVAPVQQIADTAPESREPTAAPTRQVRERPRSSLPSGFQPAATGSGGATNANKPAVALPPDRQPAAINRPAAARPAGEARLQRLADNRYTIQLTSLARAGQLDSYLRRHKLSPQQILAVTVDEGAGPRILVLFGDFASFSAAQSAAGSLPASIRLPWARSISGLKKLLREN